MLPHTHQNSTLVQVPCGSSTSGAITHEPNGQQHQRPWTPPYIDNGSSHTTTPTTHHNDITSEQHAKKRGPSHNTEQPQMTRRVTETLADTSKRLLPEPYDDGHVPSHQLNQPHHTLLDDAATIAKQVYTRPPTTTTKGKQPRKPKSTPTTPTAPVGAV